MLEIDLLQVVENERRPDEQIIWTDHPIPSHLARRRLAVCAMGLFMGGFMVYWILGAFWMTQKASQPQGWMGTIFPFFGLPFLAIALAMIASPLYAARKARSIVYAITTERALIIVGGRWHNVRTIGPERLQSIDRTTRSDGSGDLIFGQNVQSQAANYGYGFGYLDSGFIGVRNVRDVEVLLRELAQQK